MLRLHTGNSYRTYKYNSSNVKVFKDPKKIDLEQKIILVSEFPVSKPYLVLDFSEYIKIIGGKPKIRNLP